jgi:hypothetical protein
VWRFIVLSSFAPHLVALGVGAIFLSLVAYPLAIHLIYGWRRKADDIILSMSDKSSQLYFKTFQKVDVKRDHSKDKFREFYHQWYGRRLLVFPIFATIIVSGLSAYMLGETGELALRRFSGEDVVSKDYFALPLVATAAVVGAYAFVAWGIISGVARRNLAPADILGAAIRLTIAIPLGYSFSSLLKEDVGPFIAFAVGAFPLQTVQTIMQRLANKQLGLEMGAHSAADQVTRLSGIDPPTADRIEDADITTITQLAYCDPVQLSMRTYLPFAYVSDIVAQALAWIYLEERLDKLRCIGLRGAVEFRDLLEEMKNANKPLTLDVQGNTSNGSSGATVLDMRNIDTLGGQSAVALIPKAAKAADMSDAEFLRVALEIACDPYTEFLYATWQSDWVEPSN